MSLLLGRAGSHVQVVVETVFLPQLQLVELCPVVACPLCATKDVVVDVLAQFIDVGGRRCGAAATSSSCRS